MQSRDLAVNLEVSDLLFSDLSRALLQLLHLVYKLLEYSKRIPAGGKYPV
jgi:hypothetical protein